MWVEAAHFLCQEVELVVFPKQPLRYGRLQSRGQQVHLVLFVAQTLGHSVAQPITECGYAALLSHLG